MTNYFLVITITTFLLSSCKNGDYTCTCFYGTSKRIYRSELKDTYTDVSESSASKSCRKYEKAHKAQYPSKDSVIVCVLN